MWPKLFQASLETIAMTLCSASIAVLLGLLLGIFLAANHRERGPLYRLLQKTMGLLVNVTRSIPFIILLIALMPLTRWLIGTTIGWTAAVVPLTLGAIPFYARLAETAFREIPNGLFEAGLSMGATPLQIYSKIYLSEALPSLVRAATTLVVSLVGFSAMAGTIGGGGLGALAYHDGFQRFDTTIMIYTVLLLIALVQSFQMLGDRLSRLFEHH